MERIRCDNADTELDGSAAGWARNREIEWGTCTINETILWKDRTSTFPILEEGVFNIHGTNTLKAASNLLRKLSLIDYDNDIFLKEVYIDCPGLIYFIC